MYIDRRDAIGSSFATSISMTLIIIRMKVHSEKRMELSQTIASLAGSIRMEKGCQRCDFCQSILDENIFFFIEEWEDPECFLIHLKSDYFKILRGAMNLLKEPCEKRFYTVSYIEGMEYF